MGNQQTLPTDKTELISLESFYNNREGPPQNIYESRWSTTSTSKQLIHKTISFTESTETITRYLTMYMIESKVDWRILGRRWNARISTFLSGAGCSPPIPFARITKPSK